MMFLEALNWLFLSPFGNLLYLMIPWASQLMNQLSCPAASEWLFPWHLQPRRAFYGSMSEDVRSQMIYFHIIPEQRTLDERERKWTAFWKAQIEPDDSKATTIGMHKVIKMYSFTVSHFRTHLGSGAHTFSFIHFCINSQASHEFIQKPPEHFQQVALMFTFTASR